MPLLYAKKGKCLIEITVYEKYWLYCTLILAAKIDLLLQKLAKKISLLSHEIQPKIETTNAQS